MKFKVTAAFRSKLAASLLGDVSDNNRKAWAEFITENQVPVIALADLVLEKHPVGMRFIWMIGYLADTAPGILRPAVCSFYKLKGKVEFPNYDRSLAKLFYRVGIPAEVEGEVISDLFTWLSDNKRTVSVKTFALLALVAAIKKYPDLQIELKAIIAEQLEKNSVSFRKQGTRVLNKLS